MKQDIILAGVGGQGILSIAYVIDNAALADGLAFKQAEVHGVGRQERWQVSGIKGFCDH